MRERVYTIDRQQSLYNKTLDLLEELGYYKIRTFLEDGFEGLERFAPFDKILITAAPESVPQKLYGQLEVGGKMVFPLGEEDGQQQMIRLSREEQGSLSDKLDLFRFEVGSSKSW